MSSDLNWLDPKTLERADPYLAWADATAYASYRLPHGEPGEADWGLVLIELTDNGGEKSPLQRLIDAVNESLGALQVQVPPVYAALDAQQRRFRYCTARVTRGFFKAVLAGGALSDVVARYRLCTPVEYPVEPLKSGGATSGDLAGANGRPVIALIDGGLALGHSAFLKPDSTPRVAHFWRQDDHQGSRYLEDRERTTTPWQNGYGHWIPSSSMGYGAELDRAAISAAMNASQYLGHLDEDALYRRLGLWDLDRLAHHGTHVLSLAAGPYRYPEQMGTESSPPLWGGFANDDPKAAEGCDLVAVQLAWANVLDTSGRSGDAYILDALMYVWARCDPNASLTVNLSWGCSAGPHDGSSILEKAMLDWCGLRSASKIVVPAGNSYQARGHANVKLLKDVSISLDWNILPENHTPSFLELWIDKEVSTNSVRVHLTPPGQKDPITIESPGVTQWPALGGAAQATLVMLNRPNLSTTGSMILIAVQPTAAKEQVARAPAGVWNVALTNLTNSEISVCAYIERNDVAMGLFTGAKQSHFEDDAYNQGDAVDDSNVQRASAPMSRVNNSKVRRTGSFNHLSTGSDGTHVTSVGGHVEFPTDATPKSASFYSPRWSDTHDTRVAGRKKAPDTMLPCDDSPVLLGLRAAASRSGAVVRLVGTSSAVPLGVRILTSGGKLPTVPRPPSPAPAPVGTVTE